MILNLRQWDCEGKGWKAYSDDGACRESIVDIQILPPVLEKKLGPKP